MAEIETFLAGVKKHMPSLQITHEPEVLRDYTIDGILPRLVVTPDNKEQVAQVTALVSQHGLTLLARGGGSRMNLGGIPEQVDVVLETQHMTRLLEYEAPDLTCHVEAGITFAALQAQLASKGQWVALDPADAGHRQQPPQGVAIHLFGRGPRRPGRDARHRQRGRPADGLGLPVPAAGDHGAGQQRAGRRDPRKDREIR